MVRAVGFILIILQCSLCTGADETKHNGKTLKQWTDQAVAARDVGNRNAALWALQSISKTKGVEKSSIDEIHDAVVKALKDENSTNRCAALQVLSTFKLKEDFRAVIPCLHDKNETVRYQAADALGALGAEDSVAALEATLKSAKEKMLVRQHAAFALGSIGGDTAKKALLSARKGKLEEVLSGAIDGALDSLDGIGR